jgi:hypothetical protein
MCHQFHFLLGRQPEHEFLWKARSVAFDLPVQVLRLHSIQFSEVTVDHHLLSSDEQDPLLDLFNWYQDAVTHYHLLLDVLDAWALSVSFRNSSPLGIPSTTTHAL